MKWVTSMNSWKSIPRVLHNHRISPQHISGQDTHATSLNIPKCVGEHAHVGFWNRVTEMCFPCSIWKMQRVKFMPWSITSRAEMLAGLGLDAWWIHLSRSSFSVWIHMQPFVFRSLSRYSIIYHFHSDPQFCSAIWATIFRFFFTARLRC